MGVFLSTWHATSPIYLEEALTQVLGFGSTARLGYDHAFELPCIL